MGWLWLAPLQRHQQLGQQCVELALLREAELREKLLLPAGARVDVSLEALSPFLRELEQHAAAIVGVRDAPDQPAGLELVQPIGHRTGRDVQVSTQPAMRAHLARQREYHLPFLLGE